MALAADVGAPGVVAADIDAVDNGMAGDMDSARMDFAVVGIVVVVVVEAAEAAEAAEGVEGVEVVAVVAASAEVDIAAVEAEAGTAIGDVVADIDAVGVDMEVVVVPAGVGSAIVAGTESVGVDTAAAAAAAADIAVDVLGTAAPETHTVAVANTAAAVVVAATAAVD